MRISETLAIILVLVVLALVGGLVYYLATHPAALAAVVAFLVACVLGLICVGVWMVSSWWTRKTMKEGAEIVIAATGDNDAWDAKKTQSFAQLAKTMYAQSGRAIAAQDTPMLPLQQEGGSWLPEPRDFGGEESEWVEADTDANGQPKWEY